MREDGLWTVGIATVVATITTAVAYGPAPTFLMLAGVIFVLGWKML